MPAPITNRRLPNHIVILRHGVLMLFSAGTTGRRDPQVPHRTACFRYIPEPGVMPPAVASTFHTSRCGWSPMAEFLRSKQYSDNQLIRIRAYYNQRITPSHIAADLALAS